MASCRMLSYVRYDHMDTLNNEGAVDLVSVITINADHSRCCNACEQLERCAGFTVFKESCYLKAWGSFGLVNATNITSYVKHAPPPANPPSPPPLPPFPPPGHPPGAPPAPPSAPPWSPPSQPPHAPPLSPPFVNHSLDFNTLVLIVVIALMSGIGIGWIGYWRAHAQNQRRSRLMAGVALADINSIRPALGAPKRPSVHFSQPDAPAPNPGGRSHRGSCGRARGITLGFGLRNSGNFLFSGLGNQSSLPTHRASRVSRPSLAGSQLSSHPEENESDNNPPTSSGAVLGAAL